MLTALSTPELCCAGLGHGCSFVLEGPGVQCSWVWARRRCAGLCRRGWLGSGPVPGLPLCLLVMIPKAK